MHSPWTAAGKPRDCCKAEALPKSLRLDDICNVVHLCAHHRGCIMEQSTLNLHLYVVQSDKYCSFFLSGRLWLNLYFTNPFLIADVMIRQKGLDFERLITSVFILFLFYFKQQKTKVSIARLFICSAVLLPRCDHWKQTAVT